MIKTLKKCGHCGENLVEINNYSQKYHSNCALEVMRAKNIAAQKRYINKKKGIV